MRILHVIASVDPATGGPVEALQQLGAVMSRLGHRVDVLTLDDPAAAWLGTFPLPVHAVGPRTRPYSYAPGLAGWLRAHRHQYDAAVLHGIWNYASFGSWRGLRGATPYLVYVHGMLDPWFKQAYPLKHWVKQLYWLGAEGPVLRDASAVLFTNEEERRLARGCFRGHHYRERVVSFGTRDVDGAPDAQIARFGKNFPEFAHRRFLLFLSRIHPKKGCDLLIQAFAARAHRHPDLDLVIAGPDQAGQQLLLQRLATERGIGDRVHWPGMLRGDDKWGAMRAAEALVLPSHQENFGIVVAEAMACRKPVLITNKVNIWREVQASGGGLVASDNADDVGRMLDRYLGLSHAEQRTMGEHARAGFLRNFDIEMAARDLIAACEEARQGYRSRQVGSKGVEPAR